MNANIEKHPAQIDKLRRMLFGQSSEKQRVKTERQLRQAEKQLEAQLRHTRFGLPDTVLPKRLLRKLTTPAESHYPTGCRVKRAYSCLLNPSVRGAV